MDFHRRPATRDAERHDPHPDVSVVISTYNRAERLPLAIEALRTQTGEVAYEIVVVDNNSTDATREVVLRLAAADARVKYAHEPRQGLSYGRNTGIDVARAPIVAFTDDDVRVAPDWIAEIRHAFDDHPNVHYVGGRVLPQWVEPPPAWLTSAHWSPLALQDYGGAPMTVGRERAICLVGASLAFRREVFDRIGLFAPSLGRIKDGIGSTEDHDMQLRIWQAGMSGLYVPAIRSIADVTPDRMVRAYHRRWHLGHGRHCAMMRLRELVPADLGPLAEPRDLVTLFGSPAFVYRELIRNGMRWGAALLRGRDAFFYANGCRHCWGYIRTSYRIFREDNGRSAPAELGVFARTYARKALRRFAPRPAA